MEGNGKGIGVCVLWDYDGRCLIWLPVYEHVTSTEGNDYKEDQDDYYDPYAPSDDTDDPWEDPGPPPPPLPIEYPAVPSIDNGEFSIFFVGCSYTPTLIAAKYPYHRTENGDPLFKYTITTGVGQTDFTISDNIGDMTVSISEELLGKYCTKLTHRRGRMTVKVWGGGTTEPFEIATISPRNVTFDASKIIAGN